MNAGTGNLVNLCVERGAANECRLPASLSEVQFVVRGLRPEDRVRVFDPLRREILSGQGAVISPGEGVQRWRIRTPQKGQWRVESSNATAQLAVSQVLVPQRFIVQVDPARPVAGGNVAFGLQPVGDLAVDLPSLLSEDFELRMQAEGAAESQHRVRLVQSASGGLRTEPAVPVTAGKWSASVLLKVGADALLLGDAQFTVAPPGPPPTATATATPMPTATATATATAVPPPAVLCEVLVDPPAGSVPRYRLAFKLGWPLRFSEPQPFSAGVQGDDCPNRPVEMTLRLAPDDGTDGLCAAPANCEWRGSVRPPQRLQATPDETLLRVASLTRMVTAAGPNGKPIQHEDHIELLASGWADLERRSFIGYWLPFAVLAAALYAISYAATRQKIRVAGLPGGPLPLRDLAIYDRRSQPLVRAGAIVWRPFRRPGGVTGAISLKYLIAGPPVGRVWAAWQLPMKQPSVPQRLTAWWASMRKYAAGTSLDQLGVALTKINRNR